MKISIKPNLLFIIVLALFALSACNLNAAATPTDSVSAIYTSAALTVTAQAGQATDTPVPTETAQASATVSATPSKTPDSSPIQEIPSASPNQTGFCDNSAYVSDVTIPDHTAVTAGQGFIKTWAFKNIGTCTWTPTYRINYFSGEAMSGVATVIGLSVAPGQQANISINLVAPATTGESTGYWRLANDQGAGFGQTVSVVIDVSTDTTGTPTLTLTPGSTGAPTKTRTPAPTSMSTATYTATVPAPVSTPTNTQAPSPTVAPTGTPTVSSPAATLTPTPSGT